MNSSASGGIRGLVKQRLVREMVKGVQGQYKIVLADEPAIKILNAAFRVHELMDHGITLVDNISNKRQPMPTFPAIYFVSPTEANINRIVEDFNDPKGRHYQSAHLFFTTTCPRALMNKLGQHQKVVTNVKAFVDMQIDFHAIEPLVFTLDHQRDLMSFFGASFSEVEVTNVAIRLFNAIKCSGVTRCAVRFQQGALAATRVAKKVQEIMQSTNDMAQPTGSASFQPIGGGAVPPMLLVVDRSLDMVSPFLHDVAVHGMLRDLLPSSLKDGQIYRFDTVQDGKPIEKPMPLDDEDDIWCKFRHQHVVEVLSLNKALNEQFLRDFAAAVKVERDSSKATDAELAEATRTLAKYRTRKQLLSMHTQIVERLTGAYRSQGIDMIVPLEQRLATGKDVDGADVSVSTCWKREVQPILTSTDKRYSDDSKIRLALLYAVCSSADQLNEVKEAAKGTTSLQEAQLQALSIFEPWGKKKQSRLRVPSSAPLHKHTARFDPAIKRVVADLIKGTLPTADFPFTDDAMAKKIEEAMAAESRRREEEARKKQSKFAKDFGSAAAAAGTGGGNTLDLGHGEIIQLSSAQRVFVFVVGGLTNMERRAMYELTRTMNREIIIGGTSELDPARFPASLGALIPAPAAGSGSD